VRGGEVVAVGIRGGIWRPSPSEPPRRRGPLSANAILPRGGEPVLSLSKEGPSEGWWRGLAPTTAPEICFTQRPQRKGEAQRGGTNRKPALSPPAPAQAGVKGRGHHDGSRQAAKMQPPPWGRACLRRGGYRGRGWVYDARSPTPSSPPRHAELVSASMLRPAQSALAAQWTLKQVQGDEWEGGVRGGEVVAVWDTGAGLS